MGRGYRASTRVHRRQVPTARKSEKLWALTDKGPCQVRADRLASHVDESGRVRCSADNGAKGPRVYDWTAVDIRAYEAERNESAATIDWRFTAKDGRAKLRRLYPDTSALTRY